MNWSLTLYEIDPWGAVLRWEGLPEAAARSWFAVADVPCRGFLLVLADGDTVVSTMRHKEEAPHG